MDRKCIVCNNSSTKRLIRDEIQYWQCSNCKTLFCDELDNADKVGGEWEVERNDQQNHLRIGRINEMVYGSKKEEVNILDFGAGHGYFIRDLKNAGFPNVDGYDAYNDEFSKLPTRDTYHVVTMTEVIEHLTAPFYELDVVHRCLLKGGAVLIETSFIDVAAEDGIALEDFFYISPKAGHSTIFSHHGLDLLMALKGFTPAQCFNRNVKLYIKK